MKDINFFFTPYNPESPSLQTGDEGNFKSKDKEKPRPLGRGYTGFTILSIFYIAGIFLLADSPIVQGSSAFNPYSLLHIPLYGILTVLLVFSFCPLGFKGNVPNVPKDPNVQNDLNVPNDQRFSEYMYKRFFIAGFIAFGVSIADEIHQSFIPTRDASITDVFLNLIGITFVLFLFHQLYKKKKARLSI